MIGVLFNADEATVVEEFFQLFKTPWEPWHSGRSYDTVLATTDPVSPPPARLLILFGSGWKQSDAGLQLESAAVRHGAWLQTGSLRIPIHGDLRTFASRGTGVPCAQTDGGVAGWRIDQAEGRCVRLGYDLFAEVQHLLTDGQAVEHARIPSLDRHIQMLRGWILEAGIPVVEIPPTPSGFAFTVCLTHDIDFIGIRQHRADHTLGGFLYRATFGAAVRCLRRRISGENLLRCWAAVASLPLVFLGVLKDFWWPFDWYLRVERGLRATYFLIPFKHRAGEKLTVRNAKRRATAYDVTDLSGLTGTLRDSGCELGVHGIDSWHDEDKARKELDRVAAHTGPETKEMGIRMHWLQWESGSFRVLEAAGYSYDSTWGYNETPGYRAGTLQAFRPLGVQRLMELPMHIQDGALFFPQRLDLSEAEAWNLCGEFIRNAAANGGVLTILWHDRSHGPERFWGGFYERLINHLKGCDVWFANAGEAVRWFRARRSITFVPESGSAGDPILRASSQIGRVDPPLTVRVHRPISQSRGTATSEAPTYFDVPWTAEKDLPLGPLLRCDPDAPVSSQGPEAPRRHPVEHSTLLCE